MKIVVDFDKCTSNAVCMGIAPEVFEVRDDNFLYVLQEEPPESARGLVEQTVRAAGCATLGLNVFSSNSGALALYRKVGFNAVSSYFNKAL